MKLTKPFAEVVNILNLNTLFPSQLTKGEVSTQRLNFLVPEHRKLLATKLRQWRKIPLVVARMNRNDISAKSCKKIIHEMEIN